MKLSEAILKGIEDTPQAKHGFIDRPTNGRCSLTCAMYGAKLISGTWDESFFCTLPKEGHKNDDSYCIINKTLKQFPELNEKSPLHDWSLWDEIVEMNLIKSREEIVAWLQSIGL